MFYGLGIITLAWLIQWWVARRGQRSLHPWFLRLMAVGFLVLTIETFAKTNIVKSIPAVLSLLCILLLLLKNKK